jgi:hypothetical protein
LFGLDGSRRRSQSLPSTIARPRTSNYCESPDQAEVVKVGGLEREHGLPNRTDPGEGLFNT